MNSAGFTTAGRGERDGGCLLTTGILDLLWRSWAGRALQKEMKFKKRTKILNLEIKYD
jgi:hypothetical protein